MAHTPGVLNIIFSHVLSERDKYTETSNNNNNNCSGYKSAYLKLSAYIKSEQLTLAATVAFLIAVLHSAALNIVL